MGTDGRPKGAVGRVDGRTCCVRTDGRMCGQLDGRMAGLVDGRTDGRMDGSTNGRTSRGEDESVINRTMIIISSEVIRHFKYIKYTSETRAGCARRAHR